MDLNKLTEEDIIAYVQYVQGNNEYFRLDESRVSEIKILIESNEHYQKQYEKILSSYPSSQNKVKENTYRYITAAAILLISFSSYFLLMSSPTYDIEVNDFGLRIERSQSVEETEQLNEMIFHLREGDFEEVVDRMQTDPKLSGSLVYAAALTMLGQETENVALLKQAKAILFLHDVDTDLLNELDDLIRKYESR